MVCLTSTLSLSVSSIPGRGFAEGLPADPALGGAVSALGGVWWMFFVGNAWGVWAKYGKTMENSGTKVDSGTS